MKNLFRIIISTLLITSSSFAQVSALTNTSPNLIPNSSFQTATNASPANWHTGKWGTNATTFTYETATGHTDTASATVSISGYTSGDAKWFTDPVAVSSQTAYSYSDYYKSTVSSRVVAALTDAAGATTYMELPMAPSSASWAQYATSFTTLASTQSVTIYHLLDKIGVLSIDDVSLSATTLAPTPTPTPDPMPTPVPADGNLLLNPSVETATTLNQPSGWLSSAWGTNSTSLTYKDGGHTGVKSLYANTTSYTSGDAKWYAAPVAVTPGQTYTYSDYYQSNTATELDVALTDNLGKTTYIYLGVVAASSTWTPVSRQFTVPANAATVSVYHLIHSTGWLQTDDFSLRQNQPVVLPPTTPVDSSNLISNPSLETAVNGKPAAWSQAGWGTHTVNSEYLTNDAHDGVASAKITVSNYVSGDEKWYFTPITSVTGGKQYTFSAWYKTNAQPHMVAAYTTATGATQYMNLSEPLANGSTTAWQHYIGNVSLPAGATSLTVFALLSSNGWLQVDDYSLTPYVPTGFSRPLISLTFDDGWQSIYSNALPLLKTYQLPSTQYIISGTLNTTGYMTSAMVKAFQTQGSEIGAHTVTHPDLTTLSPSQLTAELTQSKATLQNKFGPTVAQNFASPYGAYNQTTLNAISQYYRSQRSTDTGYNSKDNFNIYNIVVQNILATTTPAEVASWVARAKAEHTWLVIVYHQVDLSGDAYSVTPANLKLELANIVASGVTTKTLGGALDEIVPQL